MDKEHLAKLGKIKDSLEMERQIYLSKWKELAPFLGISFSNWDNDSTNEKLADTKPILDSTADEAGDLMANGIQGYACGSNNPWLSLSFENEKYQKSSVLGGALKASEDRIYKQFNKASFYDASLAMTLSVVHLATGIMWMEEDPKRGQPVYSVLHPRDCYIQENSAHEVDVLFREFWLTQEEAMEQFGDSCSDSIRNGKDATQKFQFVNYVAPRSRYGMRDQVQGEKNYISVYWEVGKTDKTVKEEEYTRKPFAVWRFSRALFGGAWGVDSPGMKKLSDIKQVNGLCDDRFRLSRLTARPYGKKTRGLKVNITPNGFTELGPGEDYTVMRPTNDLSWTQVIIEDLQKKIRAAYYSDYFLILSSTIEQRKTATEANGLQEEKSVIMASFFSRMCSEFLEPVIEWTFMNEGIHGRLPEFSEALSTSVAELRQRKEEAGEVVENENELLEEVTKDLGEVKVDFISQLAKTQERASKHQPNIAYANQILALLQVFPEARYKIDIYNFIDDVAKNFGTNSKIVVPTSRAKRDYETVVKAQQEAAIAQVRLNALQQAGKAYKDFSSDIGENSAIGAMGGENA